MAVMVSLMVFVYLYPLYTNFYSNLMVGAMGNVLTLGMTVWAARVVGELSPKFSQALIPQILWIVIATIYVALQILGQP